MALADGLDQCQAQADAAFSLAGTRQAVKGLKDTLSLVRGYAGATIAHSYHGKSLAADLLLRQLERGITLAVTFGVFQQVSYQAAQQAWRAAQLQTLARGRNAQLNASPGAFLSRQAC